MKYLRWFFSPQKQIKIIALLSKKIYLLIVTIACYALINSSCKKPVDDSGVAGGGSGSGSGGGSGTADKHGVIYYDYLAYNAHPSVATKSESYRVCFDMNKNELRWKKKNELPVITNFPTLGSPMRASYSKAFLQTNSIIKIFPFYDAVTTTQTGVYFQKIDITSGDAVISKRIIEPLEYNTDIGFIISEVVTDGQNFYFSCNNGFIYCFNPLGNLVWKKGGFKLVRGVGSSYSFLYYSDNQVYFSTYDPFTLNCLNAATGDVAWTTPGLENGSAKELAFSKNHLVLFESSFNGRTYIIRKSDGQKISENSPGPVSSAFITNPIGAINDNTVVYYDRNADISHIDVTQPGIKKTVDLDKTVDQENSILYKEKIYSIRVTSDNKITAYVIDPNAGIIQTNAMSIPLSQNFQFFKHKYAITNDKLYILSTGRFENNLWNTTVPVNDNIPLSVSVFDINSGNALKQYYNLPGGITDPILAHAGIYGTEYHFLYNLIITE